MKNDITGRCFDGRLEAELSQLSEMTGGSMDLNISRISINGIACAVVTVEGMVSAMMMADLVFAPLMSLEGSEKRTPAALMTAVTGEKLMSCDSKTTAVYTEAASLLFSGFALILIDGVPYASAQGIQGYEKRSVSTPQTENNVLGAQDAFTETMRINMSLVRRRLKDSRLRFELSNAGGISKTDICIAYIEGKTDERLLDELRKRISEIGLDSVLGAGFVKPFLEGGSNTRLFSEVGYTERPDMLCLNLIRGAVGIIIDGTPYALICPYMFSQHFETIDDYSAKTYYAVFLKFIRYIAFILATAFPGMYLAAVNFDPEMLNMKLLLNLSAGEKTTLFSLFSELVLIMILLELLREASVRLPQAIGTAMSIAGGLLIGDTAVKSGIISSPLLIIVGITATSSYVLPALSQQTAVIRLAFIFAGGFAGFFGISVCAVMTLANICSVSMCGVDFTSPLSPLRRNQLGSLIGRRSFFDMQQDDTALKDYR